MCRTFSKNKSSSGLRTNSSAKVQWIPVKIVQLPVDLSSSGTNTTYLSLFNQSNQSIVLAVNLLVNNMDDNGQFEEGFALLVLELTRRVNRKNPKQKSPFCSRPFGNAFLQLSFSII